MANLPTVTGVTPDLKILHFPAKNGRALPAIEVQSDSGIPNTHICLSPTLKAQIPYFCCVFGLYRTASSNVLPNS
jgi:hypothetical protein